MIGSIIRRLVSAQDNFFATGGTGATETFTYVDPSGNTLTLNKIDAAYLKFRTSLWGVSRSVDSIVPRLESEVWVGDPLYPTFAAAVATLNSAGTACTLRLPVGTHTVAADLTVNSNILLKPDKGAIIAIATTKTLTINGTLDAGHYQIFSCTGTGKVAGLKRANPNWWATNTVPGTTDMQPAFQAALNSLAANGTLIVPEGDYKWDTYYSAGAIAGCLIWPQVDGLSMVGEGRAVIYSKAHATTDYRAVLINAASAAGIHGVTIRGLTFRGEADQASVPGEGINTGDYVYDLLVENCEISYHRGSPFRKSSETPGERHTIQNNYFHDCATVNMIGAAGSSGGIAGCAPKSNILNNRIVNTGSSVFHGVAITYVDSDTFTIAGPTDYTYKLPAGQTVAVTFVSGATVYPVVASSSFDGSETTINTTTAVLTGAISRIIENCAYWHSIYAINNDLVVKGNYCEGRGLDIRGGTGTGINVKVLDNTVIITHADDPGSYVGTATNGVVSGNIIKNGFLMVFGTNITVTNNIVDSPAYDLVATYGYIALNGVNVIASNNIVYGNGKTTGLQGGFEVGHTYDSTDIKVHNNKTYNCLQGVVLAVKAIADVSIENNHFTGLGHANTSGNGIYLYTATSIDNVNIKSNNLTGFYYALYDYFLATNVTFELNRLKDCTVLAGIIADPTGPILCKDNMALDAVLTNVYNTTYPPTATSNYRVLNTTLMGSPVVTLANAAQPYIWLGKTFKTGGTTTITNFLGGCIGQRITILSAHAVTVTHGTPIQLHGHANFVMAAGDTLTLEMVDLDVWQEVSRKVH